MCHFFIISTKIVYHIIIIYPCCKKKTTQNNCATNESSSNDDTGVRRSFETKASLNLTQITRAVSLRNTVGMPEKDAVSLYNALFYLQLSRIVALIQRCKILIH